MFSDIELTRGVSRGNLTEDLSTSLPARQGKVEVPWFCEGIGSMSNHFLLFGRNQRDFFFFMDKWHRGSNQGLNLCCYSEGQPLVHQGSPKSEGFKLRNRPVNIHIHHRNYLRIPFQSSGQAPHFHCRGPCSIHGWGTKISQGAHAGLSACSVMANSSQGR